MQMILPCHSNGANASECLWCGVMCLFCSPQLLCASHSVDIMSHWVWSLGWNTSIFATTWLQTQALIGATKEILTSNFRQVKRLLGMILTLKFSPYEQIQLCCNWLLILLVGNDEIRGQAVYYNTTDEDHQVILLHTENIYLFFFIQGGHKSQSSKRGRSY